MDPNSTEYPLKIPLQEWQEGGLEKEAMEYAKKFKLNQDQARFVAFLVLRAN